MKPAAEAQAEVLDSAEAWPPLPLAEWSDTRDVIQRWTQIAGKIRLGTSPPVNHWWHSTLHVTPRGLTTTAIPWRDGAFELRFDFVSHALSIDTSWAPSSSFPLGPCSVADFHDELFARLRSLDIVPTIRGVPDEVADRTPFLEDRRDRPYDADAAHRFHRVLLCAQRVLEEFRGRFIGKASPVHFFWGSFDLAATRFSGRKAPPRPGADAVTRAAYSHECISAGFWPGGGLFPDAAFYSYAVPEPEGLDFEPLEPSDAFYDAHAHELFLPYEAVRQSPAPRSALLRFFQTTYEAAADRAGWDREALEIGRAPSPPRPIETELHPT